jgi:hypothetical protein
MQTKLVKVIIVRGTLSTSGASSTPAPKK